MKILPTCVIVAILAVAGLHVNAQTSFILRVPAEKRLPVFWQYCSMKRISDQDSLTVHRFLNEVIRISDSLGDLRLRFYAQYARRCWRIIFSNDYKKNFLPGDYQTAVNTLSETRSWALQNKCADIAASCAHFTGQVYYLFNRYGLAFEHLLKADGEFAKFGYPAVPNASQYLYALGMDFYQFEEYDKALEKFLQASNYNFFNPRDGLNTLNTIGLIYARREVRDKAMFYLKKTEARARQYNDAAWIGIALGNMGNIFLAERKYDSALAYHSKNYSINASLPDGAPEDAAKSALSIAAIYLRKQKLDSTLGYLDAAQELVARFHADSLDLLDFRRRFLKIKIDYLKTVEDYHEALQLTDSLSIAEQRIKNLLDNKILSRAIEKMDAVSYDSRLSLLNSQRNLAQLRFFFVVTGLVVILFLVVLIFRNNWLREKRQMQLAEKDRQILVAEKLRAEDGLKHSRELLNAYIDTIKEKTTLIGQLESELTDLKRSAPHLPELETLTASTREKLLTSTILTDREWQQFRSWFEQVYPGFSYRLKESYPRLSPAEARFFYLIKLDLSSREMAAMLGISIDAIHKLRYRLRKKLQLDEDTGFETIISKIS